MCEKCKGEGIRTPLGHSAQASRAPLEFKDYGVINWGYKPGHVTEEPWPLTPTLCFAYAQKSKTPPQKFKQRPGVLNL
jgi:hypothetical protein